MTEISSKLDMLIVSKLDIIISLIISWLVVILQVCF